MPKEKGGMDPSTLNSSINHLVASSTHSRSVSMDKPSSRVTTAKSRDSLASFKTMTPSDKDDAEQRTMASSTRSTPPIKNTAPPAMAFVIKEKVIVKQESEESIPPPEVAETFQDIISDLSTYIEEKLGTTTPLPHLEADLFYALFPGQKRPYELSLNTLRRLEEPENSKGSDDEDGDSEDERELRERMKTEHELIKKASTHALSPGRAKQPTSEKTSPSLQHPKSASGGKPVIDHHHPNKSNYKVKTDLHHKITLLNAKKERLAMQITQQKVVLLQSKLKVETVHDCIKEYAGLHSAIESEMRSRKTRIKMSIDAIIQYSAGIEGMDPADMEYLNALNMELVLNKMTESDSNMLSGRGN